MVQDSLSLLYEGFASSPCAVWVLSRHPGLLPQSKDMHVELDDSDLAVGINTKYSTLSPCPSIDSNPFVDVEKNAETTRTTGFGLLW